MSINADICLILEGTYPYVTGGVSNWAHELIEEHKDTSFHLLSIVPYDAELELKYQLPSNVKSLKTIRLGRLPEGGKCTSLMARRIHSALAGPIKSTTSEQPLELDELRKMIDALRSTTVSLGSNILLDREEAWEQLIELYEDSFNDHSFLDFFWSYRAIASSIYSILLTDLPKADLYHAMSTGYAGLMAARAKIETNKPVMVTEHGIYTNERRIEVVAADWLDSTASRALTVDKPRRDLRDLWIDSILNFSHVCYQACDSVITLFKGNQVHQLEDGADPAKMKVIHNGIDLNRFGTIARKRHGAPTIALIGRVVPIKDVKTYIRTCSLLKQYAPDIKAYVLGPTDENKKYFNECINMTKLLGLENNIVFTGRVDVDNYLDHIDVLVLTSLSEAQPLVILEAGACGIPTVATDVGACKEIIYGATDEEPKLGTGGIVTPLASPAATAEAILTLLSNEDLYSQCSNVIKQRIAKYYDQKTLHAEYETLYGSLVGRG